MTFSCTPFMRMSGFDNRVLFRSQSIPNICTDFASSSAEKLEIDGSDRHRTNSLHAQVIAQTCCSNRKHTLIDHEHRSIPNNSTGSSGAETLQERLRLLCKYLKKFCRRSVMRKRRRLTESPVCSGGLTIGQNQPRSPDTSLIYCLESIAVDFLAPLVR